MNDGPYPHPAYMSDKQLAFLIAQEHRLMAEAQETTAKAVRDAAAEAISKSDEIIEMIKSTGDDNDVKIRALRDVAVQASRTIQAAMEALKKPWDEPR